MIPSMKMHTSPNQEDVNDHHHHHHHQLHHLPAMASISISLSSSSSSLRRILNRFLSPPSDASFSSIQSHLKIPSQLSSLSLSLSSTSSSASSLRHYRNPLSSGFSFLSSLSSPFRRRPTDPSAGAAGGRRCTLVWFRADLRLHDNEALAAASAASLSLLPVFVLDPSRDLPQPSAPDRAGARQRARFLLDAVDDLRRRLRDRGSDLVVRVGRPEDVLPELARAVGADAVHAHRGTTRGEARAEESVAQAMEAEGVEVKYFWGSTLHHIDDLPFDVEQMPAHYGVFKEKMEGVAVRKAMEVPEDVKGLPARGNVEPGDIPSLQELGFDPASQQDGKLASPVGGETEALERFKKYAAECQAQPKTENKNSTRDSIYGACFSSKILPWLATGCISPRFIFEELKNTTSVVSSATGVDNEMKWLKSELMLRDFFRFTTTRYSSRKKIDVVPAKTSAGV